MTLVAPTEAGAANTQTSQHRARTSWGGTGDGGLSAPTTKGRTPGTGWMGWPADTGGERPSVQSPKISQACWPPRLRARPTLPAGPSHLKGKSRYRGRNSNRTHLGDHERHSWVGTASPPSRLQAPSPPPVTLPQSPSPHQVAAIQVSSYGYMAMGRRLDHDLPPAYLKPSQSQMPPEGLWVGALHRRGAAEEGRHTHTCWPQIPLLILVVAGEGQGLLVSPHSGLMETLPRSGAGERGQCRSFPGLVPNCPGVLWRSGRPQPRAHRLTGVERGEVGAPAIPATLDWVTRCLQPLEPTAGTCPTKMLPRPRRK